MCSSINWPTSRRAQSVNTPFVSQVASCSRAGAVAYRYKWLSPFSSLTFSAIPFCVYKKTGVTFSVELHGYNKCTYTIPECHTMLLKSCQKKMMRDTNAKAIMTLITQS
jgi:hypothetical protein